MALSFISIFCLAYSYYICYLLATNQVTFYSVYHLFALCPAHVSFYCLITCIISLISVCSLIHVDFFQSLAISIQLCSFHWSLCISEFSSNFVNFLVLNSYIIADIMHSLYTLLFKHTGKVPLIIPLFLFNHLYDISYLGLFSDPCWLLSVTSSYFEHHTFHWSLWFFSYKFLLSLYINYSYLPVTRISTYCLPCRYAVAYVPMS